jgi:hypothetical protein
MHESQRYGKLTKKPEECRRSACLAAICLLNWAPKRLPNQSTEFSPGGRKDRGNVGNFLCAKCVLFAPAMLAGTWPAG